jgi:hypothetical protein
MSKGVNLPHGTNQNQAEEETVMGFMTMLLTNPFLYSWIVEKIINEVKNLSMRVKKVGSMRLLNRVAKTQSENCSRERLLHKNMQNVRT